MHSLYKWILAVTFWMGVAFSVSAQTLSPGMNGPLVTDLQNQLVSAGYLARTVDGDYGSTTKKAVALFQKDHNLTVTGVADDKTQAAIRSVPSDSYRSGGGVIYARGNRGNDVLRLQQKLSKAGYLKGALDGVYGEDTEKAVIAYQKDHEVPVSGAIDEMTYSGILGESGSTADSKKSYGPVLYSRGDRGDEVASIQKKLQKLGYLDDIADGIYGENTVTAIRYFQRENGLYENGNIDKNTMDMLNSVYGSNTGSFSLAPGDRGQKVIRLQNKLLLHGYNPGTVDGVYGEGTANAVRKLQLEEKLEATGIADDTVWEKLNAVPRFPRQYKKMLRMTVTAYTPNDGSGSGRTALGNYAGKGHVAVDPNVIPLNSIVYVEGYGYAIADDIGGAIQGMIIDIGVDTLQQAYNWGTKENVKVYIIR